MSKSAKHFRTASRPPVNALQYEKLALSAFGLIERQIAQLDKLVTLAASIYRSPALTRDERARQRKLLGLLIDTGEDYQQEVETDRDLYQIIALDAKGIPQSRITARHAANLLAKTTRTASEGRKRVGASKGSTDQASSLQNHPTVDCNRTLTLPRYSATPDVKKGAINAPFP